MAHYQMRSADTGPEQHKRGSGIVFDNVRKDYHRAGGGAGSHAAVDGVTFRIEPGEFIVLLGPSGCGKTTLLKLINRLIEPTSGTIAIDGVEIHRKPAVELRRGIGYVIQQSGLFPHLRVRDNVAVVPSLLKWPKEETAQRVNDLLDLVGLPAATYANRYPAQLSGGEQQRVGLARALAVRPRTMLMDEPFGALDAITRVRLQDEVKRIHQQFHQTIVFVTHDIEEAVKLADRIVIMRDGRVVQIGSPVEVVTAPANAFVTDLVGAGDLMRRLALLPVGQAVVPASPGVDGLASLGPAASLREALSLVLESPAGRAAVRDGSDSIVGEVSLASIQQAVATGEPTPAVPVSAG